MTSACGQPTVQNVRRFGWSSVWELPRNDFRRFCVRRQHPSTPQSKQQCENMTLSSGSFNGVSRNGLTGMSTRLTSAVSTTSKNSFVEGTSRTALIPLFSTLRSTASGKTKTQLTQTHKDRWFTFCEQRCNVDVIDGDVTGPVRQVVVARAVHLWIGNNRDWVGFKTAFQLQGPGVLSRAWTRGLLTFLSEGHISCYTTVRVPEILRGVMWLFWDVIFYQINKFFAKILFSSMIKWPRGPGGIVPRPRVWSASDNLTPVVNQLQGYMTLRSRDFLRNPRKRAESFKSWTTTTISNSLNRKRFWAAFRRARPTRGNSSHPWIHPD